MVKLQISLDTEAKLGELRLVKVASVSVLH